MEELREPARQAAAAAVTGHTCRIIIVDDSPSCSLRHSSQTNKTHMLYWSLEMIIYGIRRRQQPIPSNRLLRFGLLKSTPTDNLFDIDLRERRKVLVSDQWRMARGFTKIAPKWCKFIPRPNGFAEIWQQLSASFINLKKLSFPKVWPNKCKENENAYVVHILLCKNNARKISSCYTSQTRSLSSRDAHVLTVFWAAK